MEPFVLIVGGVVVAAFFTILGIIKANLFICQPNEALIFSGRKRDLTDGSRVGYRIVQGGRGFRIPIVERVDRIQLNTIPIDLTVTNAYSKGGIPLTVRAIANVKVASKETELANAVERLLGKEQYEIQTIAKETLEGNLRGVLATLTPEEVNEDRLKFGKELLAEADSDLSNLGLQLDTMKIQSVEDEVGYLDAIGRQQSAHIIAAARIAEAEKKEQARLAEAGADKKIEQAENELRILKAKLAAAARTEEARVEVAANVSEAQAKQELALEQIKLSEKTRTRRRRGEGGSGAARQRRDCQRERSPHSGRRASRSRSATSKAGPLERGGLGCRAALPDSDASRHPAAGGPDCGQPRD